MKKQTIMRVTMVASAAALCIAMAGCSSAGLTQNANTNANNTTTQNNAYMSQVNQAVSDLDTKLEDFVDAVSRNDTVSMRTTADRAMNTLNTLENLEATDEIADIKAKYNEGCEALKTALNEYVTLYTSGAEITQDALASAQQHYDAGVTALKEADSLATSKK